jgi:hypothetical protein
VYAGTTDRDIAAVMLQLYRVLLEYIKLERAVRVEDELVFELAEIKRERGIS